MTYKWYQFIYETNNNCSSTVRNESDSIYVTGVCLSCDESIYLLVLWKMDSCMHLYIITVGWTRTPPAQRIDYLPTMTTYIIHLIMWSKKCNGLVK
jgi:hypothetical protein